MQFQWLHMDLLVAAERYKQRGKDISQKALYFYIPLHKKASEVRYSCGHMIS